MAKFQENNDFGKKSSRKGVPNKVTAETKKLLADITEKGLKDLYARMDEMDTKELIDFVTKILPYHVPKLQNMSLDAGGETDAINITFVKKEADE